MARPIYIKVNKLTSCNLKYQNIIIMCMGSYVRRRNELVYDCCNRRNFTDQHLRRNIMFLITHKCGSSTVQNILMRFGLKHGLNFAFPKRGNYLGYFNNISEYLPKSATVKDKKYNMLVYLTRYNEYLKKIMRNDTVSITILKEPLILSESSFHFFNFNKTYEKNFRQFFTQRYKEFDYNASSQNRIQDRNHTSLDLGLPRDSFQNITEIRKFIDEVGGTVG